MGHFVNRAHLEVLRHEDLEDQLLAKKLVDIICFSPRAQPKPSLLRDNMLFAPATTFGVVPQGNRVEKFRQSYESDMMRRSIGSRAKEHFWSYEVLKQLG